jgi:hypothetical protein
MDENMPRASDSNPAEAASSDGCPDLLSLCSGSYPSDALRAALCAMGIRPLQHEIHSLRAILQRKTGLRVEDWNSPDELAKMLLVVINRSAAQREPSLPKRAPPH